MRKVSIMLFSLVFGLLLGELLVRVAFPLLPMGIQTSLRYVRRHPWTAEQLLPPPAWFADDRYQMVTQNGLDNTLQYPNPNVSFHLTTKNWLDPASHVGFRVPAAAWQPRWPVDVVVVGDSFSFCFTEYDDCWVQRMASEHGLSMVNLGQGATGSISHRNLLLTFGLPHEPDLVIWQWYGNDFNEDAGFVGAYESGAPTDESTDWAWLKANSTIYWLLRTVTGGHRNQAGFDVQVDPYTAVIDEKTVRFGRAYSREAADLSRPVNQIGRDETITAILHAKRILDEQGIALVIVLVPFKEEVYAAQMADQLTTADMTALASSRLAMHQFCADESLDCYDTTTDLTAVASEQLLYFENDTHLNAAGNALLADLIFDYLKTE